MSGEQFKVEWHDSGLEPRNPPNPAYPNGKDFDISGGAARVCVLPLKYPAPRIGGYLIECELCGLRVVVTTAGRRDDVRSVKLACKLRGSA